MQGADKGFDVGVCGLCSFFERNVQDRDARALRGGGGCLVMGELGVQGRGWVVVPRLEEQLLNRKEDCVAIRVFKIGFPRMSLKARLWKHSRRF